MFREPKVMGFIVDLVIENNLGKNNYKSLNKFGLGKCESYVSAKDRYS